MTPEERLFVAFSHLTDEQKADVLQAIICWIVWKKISPKKIKTDEWDQWLLERNYNRDMVYIITQILLHH